jgi:putative transposase
MRQQRSPGTGRRYPLTMICAVYRLACSAVYAAPAAPAVLPGKRGPKTAVSDADVVAEIRTVLAACPFQGGKAIGRCAHGLPTGAGR